MKILILLICCMLTPVVIQAQFSGGNGRGDHHYATNEFYLGNNFITDGNWSGTENWSLTRLPFQIEKPRILANAILSVDATVSGLIITNYNSLTIDPQGSLKINGHFINDGSLSIKSNHEKSGSLIYETGDIYATVERYISDSEWAWHQLSSPVQSQVINLSYPYDFDNGHFFAWFEPAQAWVSFGNTMWPTWDQVNNSSNTFNQGKGYMVAYGYIGGIPQVKRFDGLLNSGNVSDTLQRKAHLNDVYEGFNLLGNPFPSCIDWKASNGWTGRENLQETDTLAGGYNMWIWNDVSGNYGAHNSASLTDYSHLGVSRYIAPMQGFWVRAEVDQGVVSVNDNARVHSNQQWIKNVKSNPGVLHLTVSSNATTYLDEIIIEFGHQSDLGGAQKMFSMYNTSPGLYTVKHNEKWSINFLTSIENHSTVPMGFKAGKDGTYTITSSSTAHFDEVILEDKLLGRTHNFAQNNEYHFQSKVNDDPDRFLLYFKAVGIDVLPENRQINAYAYGSTLYVMNPAASQARAALYSVQGQLMLNLDLVQGMNTFGIALPQGIYLIRIFAEKRITTRRILVR